MRLPLLIASLLALTLPALAVEMGDDGLHKAPWMRDTFKDLREDLDEANAEGRRLVMIVEQRGCIYCKKMHEEVFSDPEVSSFIDENFFVIQLNMFGDVEVVDLDGDVRSEKDMAAKWGVLFTPTMIFLPEEADGGTTAISASVATMPGAFSRGTTLDLLNWVMEKGYAGDEGFQRYHARMIEERGGEQ